MLRIDEENNNHTTNDEMKQSQLAEDIRNSVQEATRSEHSTEHGHSANHHHRSKHSDKSHRRQKSHHKSNKTISSSKKHIWPWDKLPRTLKNLCFLVVSLGLIIGILLLVSKKAEEHFSSLVDENTSEYENLAYEKDELAKQQALSILEECPGLICIGDSLTAGGGGDGTTYPDVLADLLYDNKYLPNSVINFGVGGEGTYEIMARTGAISVVLAEDLKIPEDTTPVEIKFEAVDGSNLNLLRQGSTGFKYVSIGGVEGELSIEQASYNSQQVTYYFTRLEAGESITIPANTQIINDGSYLYDEYLPVIWVGQNGGWDDDPITLCSQIQKIIDSFDNKENYIILGLTTGTEESRKILETIMEETFENHYINLRNILSDSIVLESYGISLSIYDYEDISEGAIPEVIRNDSIHLNATGYEIVANLVYEKLIGFGYVLKDPRSTTVETE